jgi:flagellar hook-associated protein 2
LDRWLLALNTEDSMGTVGLSFGSPTSGAGFDVSTTVAQIVGNLQAVETPWKTQLTALESQDTVISSLGTLFSNLSNDISGLTDFQGVIAQKQGSSSDTNVLTLTAANNTATAGTHTVEVSSLAQTSSGYLAPIANAKDTLSGSITLQVGSGKAQTITLNSSNNTLAGLAGSINSSGVGVTASVLTDANGSRLSLVSATSGAGGDITLTGNTITDAVPNSLAYTGTAGTSSANSTGTLAAVASPSEALSATGSLSISVGGATPASFTMAAVNTAEGGTTLSDLESYINTNSSTLGVTASILTNSDGTSSLSLTSATPGSAGTLAVTSSIADTQTALSYTSSVSGSNAQLIVDGVSLTSASNTVANLIPGITFQLLAPSAQESDGSLGQVQVVIANDNTGVESGVAGMVSNYNALISAINTQEGNTSSGTPEPLFGSPTLSLLQQQLLGGLNMESPNGALDSVSTSDNATLSGSISIAVGSGTAQTIVLGAAPSSPAANTYYAGNGVNSVSGLASAINAANIGVTANVVTADGDSTITLLSQTAGATGGLVVNSAIVATGDTALTYSGSLGTNTVASNGTLTSIPSPSDVLSGTISIQVGTGTGNSLSMSVVNAAEGGTTLTDLNSYINANSSGLGVTSSLVTNGDGSSSLSLVSNTSGTAGNLLVNSQILDTTSLTSTTLNYGNQSDINSLTSLGISVNNDGTLTFDATSLDSVLNSDYSGVSGFFQSPNGWGQTFTTMLSNAGTSSTTGILSLASNSNSSIESTLNADISKEEALISVQQISLTTELNTANQIMQQLPSQLQGVNELYSAITGYNQNSNG